MPRNFTVHPTMKKDFGFDFGNFVGDGEAYSSHALSISPSGPAISNEIVANNIVSFTLTGISDDTEYVISCTFYKTNGDYDTLTMNLESRSEAR